MKTNWPKGIVADNISRYLRSSNVRMDIIITFDENGVSSHPNHIGVYEGCCEVFLQNQFGLTQLWTLETVNILRKYISYWDINLVLPSVHMLASFDPRPSFGSLSLHHSQFVWFRKLFIFFSRYTFVNTFNVFLLKANDPATATSKVKSESELRWYKIIWNEIPNLKVNRLTVMVLMSISTAWSPGLSPFNPTKLNVPLIRLQFKKMTGRIDVNQTHLTRPLEDLLWKHLKFKLAVKTHFKISLLKSRKQIKITITLILKWYMT